MVNWIGSEVPLYLAPAGLQALFLCWRNSSLSCCPKCLVLVLPESAFLHYHWCHSDKPLTKSLAFFQPGPRLLFPFHDLTLSQSSSPSNSWRACLAFALPSRGLFSWSASSSFRTFRSTDYHSLQTALSATHNVILVDSYSHVDPDSEKASVQGPG